MASFQTPSALHQPSLYWHLHTLLSGALQTLVGYKVVPLILVMRFVD